MTDAKKIADVAQPGQSPPSPNSKSVIISNRPTVKDPMVKPQTTGINESKELTSTEATTNPDEQVLSRTHQTVLQPLPSSPAAAPAQPAEFPEFVSPPAKVEPTQSTAAPTTTANTTAGTDAAIGTKDIQTDAQVAVAEDAEAKRVADLQQMVETKQFYLPIETTENRRSKRVVVSGILLSLLLAALWLDVALDAGLIHIGNLKAITHLFSQ